MTIISGLILKVLTFKNNLDIYTMIFIKNKIKIIKFYPKNNNILGLLSLYKIIPSFMHVKYSVQNFKLSNTETRQ